MKENPCVPHNEQETIIQISRDTKTARIYTTDSRMANKLDKIYQRTSVTKNHRRIVAVEYEVPERLINFRAKIAKRNLTEEQKMAKAEILRKNKENKAQNQF